MRWGSWILMMLAVQLLAASACSAQQPAAPAGFGAFAPTQTRRLRDFGANGDGRTDDTAAIARALATSSQHCLDGEGRSYVVNGTLRAENSLCLRNTTLLQTFVPFDTSPYIVRDCPLTENPALILNCGDPAIPAHQIDRLRASLHLRTLLIRPADERSPRIRVNLDNVTVNRGRHPEAGSRSDSAGIWLEGAERVDFRDVEITGHGKGFGLMLLRSKNVTLTNLSIHDLVWAPHRGDAVLTRSRVAAQGWNSAPFHEFREQGQDGARIPKFYGVRVQEQLACAYFLEVQRLRINNIRIERCMARFSEGDIPWQADGISIGQSSSDILIDGGAIRSTWEGIDVVGGGNGVRNLAIRDLTVSDSFSFGVKVGYQTHDVEISRLTVVRAGLSGIVVSGAADGVRISGAQLNGIGSFNAAGRAMSPWGIGSRAGIRLDVGPGRDGRVVAPTGVIIADSKVTGAPGQRSYYFGILNNGSQGLRTVRFTADGFEKAAVNDNGRER